MVSVQANTIRINASYDYSWLIDARDQAISSINATTARVIKFSQDCKANVVNKAVAVHDHALIRKYQTQQAIQTKAHAAKLSAVQQAQSKRDNLAALLLGVPVDALPDIRQRLLNPVAVPAVPAVRKMARSVELEVPAVGMNLDATVLSKALDRLNTAVCKKAHLPILGYVLIVPAGDRIILQSTDLEVGVQTSIPAAINSFEPVAVPFKELTNALKGAKGAVRLSLDDESMFCSVAVGSKRVSLQILPAEEFPLVPEIAGTWQEVNVGIFDAIKRVQSAVAKDESRQILLGILMNENNLVTTDTHRLHVADHNSNLQDWKPCIVPARVLNTLHKMLGIKAESFEVRTTENQIQFRAGDTIVTSRLIEGQFPNYQRVIPEAFAGAWTVKPAELSEALSGLLPIAKENLNRLVFESRGDILTLKAQHADNAAEAQVRLQGNSMGDFAAAFSVKYFLDAVDTFKDNAEVNIELSGECHPAKISDNSATVVLMPMQLD
jgi:DNA polymerase-3 subunit beta